MEYVLLAILLVCAVVITVAVLFQKSGEKGLSGTIAGVVFAVAVIAVYVIQPDYLEGYDVNAWKNLSQFANVFTK